jgi:SAM-dependent methyltransferase
VIKDGIKRLVNRVRDLVEPPLRQAEGIDYATYRRIQNEGFQRKIDVVFVKQANVEHICRFALSRGPVASVLCHGTRNGAEQRFPDTIEWDFHDMRPEWESAWDLIYSNSWDHALDPERAFRTWARCLSPAGLLVLEHTEFHTVRHSSDLDPFGASFKGLAAYLDKVLAPAHRVAAAITDMPDAPNGQRAVVVARA